MARVLKRERRELQRREREYREHCAPLDLRGMTALLVDDGLATGLSMRAAVIAARALGAAPVVVAVPVGSATACDALKGREPRADEVVCMHVPEPFVAVGNWYRSFGATTDEEVREILAQWR